MRLAPTTRDTIADDLGIGDGLPERNPQRSFEILTRVRLRGLHDAFRLAVSGGIAPCPNGGDGCIDLPECRGDGWHES